MRKLKTILAIIFVTGLFIGCGEPEVIDSNTIQVQKDGSITDVIVDDFDQNLYSIDELQSMTEDEIAQYETTDGAGKITLDSIEMVEDKLHVTMTFAGYADYAAYNDTDIFVGTLADAYNAGYSLDISMISAKDTNTVLVKDDLMQMGLSKVIITDYDGIIRCPNKILYYNQGTSQIDKKHVSGTAGELTYVIYK